MELSIIKQAGFNVDEAIEKIGSEDIYNKVLTVFLYETGAALILIEGARVLRDYKECCRLIHTIRGGAATLGHDGIAELSGEAEEAIGEMVEDGEITGVKSLDESLDRMIDDEIRKYIEYCSSVLKQLAGCNGLR